MICTEDEEFYPVGTTWNLYGCTVELLEVLSDSKQIIGDITVDGQTHYEEVLQDGQTYTYEAYTVTCKGFFGTDEPLVQTIICTESEPTDVLTLYFKPWSWTNIDGALADLASKSVEISGKLANILSDYTGYEYVTHTIEYRTPEGRNKKYVAMDIHLHDSTVGTSFALPAIPLAIIIKLAIVALVVLSFGIFVFAVFNKTEETNQVVKDAAENIGDGVTDDLEEDGDDVVSGEITPEEYTDIKVPDMLRKNREMCAIFKTDIAIYNRLESCVTAALGVFESSAKTQSDIVVCRNAVELCNATFQQEHKVWMDDNYGSSLWLPDLDKETLLKYAKYGLLALFGIMAAKAVID